jgi:hypothetical protein
MDDAPEENGSPTDELEAPPLMVGSLGGGGELERGSGGKQRPAIPRRRRRPSCEADDSRKPPPLPPPRGSRRSAGTRPEAAREARQHGAGAERAERESGAEGAAAPGRNPMLHVASTGYGFRVEYAAGNTSDEADACQAQRRDVRSAIDASCVLTSTNGAVQWCKCRPGDTSAHAVDPYRELGVRPDASDPELRQAYLELARDCQPRYQDSSSEAESRAAHLELLSSCFTILTSPLLRSQFDRGEFELTRLADERKDELDTEWYDPLCGGATDGGVGESTDSESWAREIYEWTSKWKEAQFSHTGVLPPPTVRRVSPER